MKSSTFAFLVVLGITLFVWVLRGARILTFMPGMVLWLLILLCFVAALISVVR